MSLTSLRFPGLVATALLAIVGCSGSGRPKVTLRYHPAAGAAYHYALEQRTSWTVESAMGPVPGQDITLLIYYTQAVTGPTAGGTAVTVIYDSTTMLPGGLAPALARMRGLTSRMVYDDRGRVISAAFTGIEGEPSPIAAQLEKSMKATALPLPETPVGVGDVWTADHESASQAGGMAPAIRMRTRFTVKEIRPAGADTTVVVGVESAFPGDPVSIQEMRQGIPEMHTVRVSGALTGERVYSLAKGVPVGSTMGGTMRIEDRVGRGDPQVTTLSQQSSLRLAEAP
jgi:hypothetical protein